MSLPRPSVPLPEVSIGEWTVVDTRTATGLFAYRHMQATGLLDLPDYGGGDLDKQQRSEALKNAVSLHRPLSALSLFLGVVALEDMIRDLAARLADCTPASSLFPDLSKLRSQTRSRQANESFKRLDTDPAGVVDPEEINERFTKTMGIAPVPVADYWHLRDLALLRHTVAHHAAVIRSADVPRFAYFVVRAGAMINPPPDFVRSELLYIYRLGRTIEVAIRNAIFEKLILQLGHGWSRSSSSAIIELIELFGYFGYIESTTVPVGYSEPGSDLRKLQEAEAARIRVVRLERCIADLVSSYGE